MDHVSGKELKEQMKKSPVRTRHTTVQEVEGFASADKVGYVKEEMSFLETDGTAREVTFISSRLCDCGRLLGQENPIFGTCQHRGCTGFTCSECARTCTRCGGTFCPVHATVYRDGEIFCHRCKPIKWLKLFFGVNSERNKG